MHYSYEMDYAEGTILNTAWRSAQGGALYQPLRGVPYQITPYPPFVYKITAMVLRHTSLDFFYPRFLSLLAGLAACLLSAILIHHRTRRWKLALIFGLLPLTIAAVQPWLGIIRYDLLGIALSLAGLVIFVIFPRYRFLAIPLFALAVAGLYTLVAAPAACCLYLWTRREWLNGILFGAALVACLVAAFLYGQHATSGSLAFHLFKTQHSPYSVSQLGSLMQAFLRGYSLLLLLSAVLIWKSFQEKEIGLILLYWLLAAGTTLSLGKIGAAQNHELQLIFATCIGAAVAYEWMRQNSSGDWGLALVLATLILVTLANTPLRPRKPIEELSQCDEAYAAVSRDLGDRILSDNVGALVLAGKPVYVSDPFVYGWLVKGAGLPDDDLRRMVTSGEFTAIVLDRRADGPPSDEDRWPNDMRAAVSRNYELKKQFSCNDARFVYEPKNFSTSVANSEARNTLVAR
jgi:hypothetical protein